MKLADKLHEVTIENGVSLNQHINKIIEKMIENDE